MKKLELTERAKQKGIIEIEMNYFKDEGTFATAIIHEKKTVQLNPREAKKAKQKQRIDDVVYPVMIFPAHVKHADYDRAKRFLEKIGFILLLPNPNEFRTELYNINLGKYQNVLKGWGYDSGLLPPTKRWSKDRINENSRLWVSDNELVAEIISFTVENMYLEVHEDGSFVLQDEELLENLIKKQFGYLGLF